MKKNLKKVLAASLAASMVMSINMVALADEANGNAGEEITTTYEDMSTITLTKTYRATNGNTISPAETFTFSDLTCTEVKDAGVGVTAENAPVPTIADVSYGAGDAGSGNSTKTITISLPNYTAVGVYTYTFAENDGNTAGVTYRADEIKLVVTVIEQNGKVRVAALHTEGETGDKSSSIDNVYSAGSLSVTKEVTGLLGDKTKDFTVTVTFTAPDGDTVREAISYTDGTEEKTIEAGWSTTAEAEITLKHAETVTFTNIPYGVTYTVVEDDYTTEENGKYDVAEYNFVDEDKEIDTPSDTVTITNNKDGFVDTGISLDALPYIMMLGMSGLGALGFAGKRRKEEDEI